MTGKILAFRHVAFEHLGRISDSLTSHDLECEYIDLPSGSAPPDIERAAGLIFMGGPMSANDEEPYIWQEIEIIRRAVSFGKPILGVCLGAQLIAKALGARVFPNPVKEIGWYPVHWTDAAAGDPLLHGLSGSDTVFHWHGETFDLPRGAELLASSELCRHQAYRVGTNIYGLQFHLEVTPEMIADWLRQDANCGDLREITAPIDPGANAAKLSALATQIFDAWCSLSHTYS